MDENSKTIITAFISQLYYNFGHIESLCESLITENKSDNFTYLQNNQKVNSLNLTNKGVNEENMPKLIKGSIRFRYDLNTYEARFTINKKQFSTYNKNKVKCILENNKKFKAHKKEIEKSINKINKSMKYYKWLEIWLKEYKTTIKKNSLRELKNNIEQHLKPIFKDRQLNQIKAIDIDMALNKMENSRTKETTFSIFFNSLKTAYNKDFLDKPIHERLEKVKYKRTEGKSLDENQRTIFLNAIEKLEYKNLFKFVYLTGVRKHGALNLKKEDIDFENETIHIKETKTINGDRILPFFNGVKEILEQQIKLNYKNGVIFKISDRQLKNNYNELEELCGFRIQLKDLRTTFATRCSEKNISDNLIIKWMGHSSFTTTKKYYIKTTQQFEKDQSKLL